jgi:hypothetical protein
MSFSYPENLLAHLTDAWYSRDSDEQHIPDLPDETELREFLEVAYHASMLTEEQRKIVFRLAYISPEVAEQLAGPEELGRVFEPVAFEYPRDFTVPEILRLAPATDHTKVMICVSPINANGESGNGKLKVWGLFDTGSSWWEFTRGESKNGVPPPNCLTLSSIEPGNLTFSRQGVVLLSLKRGEIVTPSRKTLYQGPIAAFFRSAEDALYSEVCGTIGRECYSVPGHTDDFPRQYYYRFLERLLFQIREKLHGGAVLVVPDDVGPDDPTLKNLMLIKYLCNFDNIWSLLVNALVLRYRHINLNFELYSKGSQIPIEKHHALTSLAEQRRVTERRITDSATLIASTSGVDGAVVITDRFRLIGFGAEITASPPLREVHLAEDAMAKDTNVVRMEQYGTRHRSAFRFCWEDKKSIAFVISQDGGVKGVKRVGDRLIFWPDINFGPLGI